MGFGGGIETEKGDRCKELKLERHRPLSLNDGQAALVGASEQRYLSLFYS
jgi:hypothetical protein